jgi:hypothetical protein
MPQLIEKITIEIPLGGSGVKVYLHGLRTREVGERSKSDGRLSGLLG